METKRSSRRHRPDITPATGIIPSQTAPATRARRGSRTPSSCGPSEACGGRNPHVCPWCARQLLDSPDRRHIARTESTPSRKIDKRFRLFASPILLSLPDAPDDSLDSKSVGFGFDPAFPTHPDLRLYPTGKIKFGSSCQCENRLII